MPVKRTLTPLCQGPAVETPAFFSLSVGSGVGGMQRVRRGWGWENEGMTMKKKEKKAFAMGKTNHCIPPEHTPQLVWPPCCTHPAVCSLGQR